MSIKFKKRNPQSIISQSLQSKKKVVGIHAVNFKVSFQYIDTSQKFGSGFKDWQSVGLL
jgi:hypothetical protein